MKEIGGLTYYAWSTTLFVVASIVSAALTSRLKNAVGSRHAYLVAFGIFSAGTLLCGAADTIGVLNAGRAVQGAGGGLLYALAYTVIRAVYPERLWPIAIGLITLMWGVATLLGPALGGFFAEIGQWRLAFFSLLPATFLFALLSAADLDNDTGRREVQAPVPALQLLLMVATVVTVSLASLSPSPENLLTTLLACLVFMGVAAYAEKRSSARLLPSGALKFSSELGALYLCVGFLMIGMQPEAFIPFFLQHLHGQTPLAAGYMGALMALGWTLGSAVSAGFTGKRAQNTILQGAFFSFLGLAIQLGPLPSHEGALPALLAVCLGLTLVGFGIGFCWPHLTTRIYKASPTGEGDLAAGAITTVQLFATAVGSALVGLVVNATGLVEPGGLQGISSAAFWMCLVFLGAPATAFFFAFRALPPPQSDRSDKS